MTDDTMIPEPIIILVTPQMGENIGMAARAMMNCGVRQMRIVAPRDGWPNERAVAASSGALDLMPAPALFETTADAIADLQYVYATSGRLRHMVKPILTAPAAIQDTQQRIASGHKVGILFGAERTGLLNDDLALANAILNIPTNPDFASLNLSQAVMIVCYEWLRIMDKTPDRRYDTVDSPPASGQEMQFLMTRLERELSDHGFFTAEHLRPTVMRNINNFLRRAEMTSQDVQTFQGIISALMGAKLKK
jgi:tRNA/rRNA methyltransferase